MSVTQTTAAQSARAGLDLWHRLRGASVRRWLRLLRGEDLDAVSRERKVMVAQLSEQREESRAAAEAGLITCEVDGRDEKRERVNHRRYLTRQEANRDVPWHPSVIQSATS